MAQSYIIIVKYMKVKHFDLLKTQFPHRLTHPCVLPHVPNTWPPFSFGFLWRYRYSLFNHFHFQVRTKQMWWGCQTQRPAGSNRGLHSLQHPIWYRLQRDSKGPFLFCYLDIKLNTCWFILSSWCRKNSISRCFQQLFYHRLSPDLTHVHDSHCCTWPTCVDKALTFVLAYLRVLSSSYAAGRNWIPSWVYDQWVHPCGAVGLVRALHVDVTCDKILPTIPRIDSDL